MRKFLNKNTSLKYLAAALGLYLCVIPSYALNADVRDSSINCSVEKSLQVVECDYRHAASYAVKDVSLIVGGTTLQIPEKGLVTFPAADQTTALLFLIDTSDPRRKKLSKIEMFS